MTLQRINISVDSWIRFKPFEEWLNRNAPKRQHTARQKYNIIGPIIATKISQRCQANLKYLALKPLEWFCECCRLAMEAQTSDEDL